MPDADMDQAADALIGAGYGAAGERCMAISVAVPVTDDAADRLLEKLIPRVEKLKVGPYTAGDDVDYGPVITAEAKQKILGLVESGVKEGAKLAVDGRDFNLQGYEDGNFIGPCLFDNVTKDMEIYKQEIFGAYHTFGGWKKSVFGDLNQHGPDAFKFYTRTKTVTSRWPSGIKEGGEFSIPVME